MLPNENDGDTTASRTALGPTQPSIQWVTGALPLGTKRPGREADHSPPSSAEVKAGVELYLHSPNKPSCRGAHLKHKYFTFTFTFTFLPNNAANFTICLDSSSLLTYSVVQDIILKADCHSVCQKISCFLYGTRRFITVFTKARHWTLY
jgi:hypothetical protein